MKRFTLSKACLPLILVLGQQVLAYESTDNKPVCKKPRFTDFSLPEYHAENNNPQVNPEAEFFFKLPADVDPSSISLLAKKRPLPFTIETTSTFHKVTAHLPASFTGYYVRLDAYAKTALGCDNHHGWLIKVSGHKILTPSE